MTGRPPATPTAPWGVALALAVAACSASSAGDGAPPLAGGGTATGNGGAVTSGAGGAAAGGSATGGLGSGGDPGVVVVPPPTSGGAAAGDSGTGSVETPCASEITALVRDFTPAHPDFERPIDWLAVIAGDRGIVLPNLVAGYPAYTRPSGGSPSTTGPLEFYQWYVDTPGVNQTFPVTLPLTEVAPGRFVYESFAFFPIDGLGFGNEGNPHNFHFTTEVRTTFTYSGGETFTFRGDDDLWMFVNGAMVIDLGGLHPALEATVNMDAEAARLGLVRGSSYSMDIFHAERHTSDSNFRIETTIRCFTAVEPPPPPPPPEIR